MPRPDPLQIHRESSRESEHPQGVGRGGTVDHHHIPFARIGELLHLMQSEHLLHARQRGKLFGGKRSDIRFRILRGNSVGDVTPTSFQQAQSVQRHDIELAPVRILDHPHAMSARGWVDPHTEDIAQGMGLVGRYRQYPLPGTRMAHSGGAGQRRLAHAPLADEQTDGGCGRCVDLGGGVSGTGHEFLPDVASGQIRLASSGL
ncbi:Uncharacterised protein [Mycobacteroides abscessus subsp. abscessus]|nr:Uncharacterised protein [Mycobacteroides abscessus subsp. abscessus]